MKIAFFDMPEKQKEVMETLLPGLDVSYYEEKLCSESVIKVLDAEIISVFIDSNVSKEVIDALPNLKLISTRSTGFDHIDVLYAKLKGIAVVSVPAYGSRTVAEFAFGLILALSRKLYDASMRIKMKMSYDISAFQGFDLYGKTLGVIGTGRIGKNSVLIGKGFGMKIIATDVYRDLEFAKENDVEYVSLEKLLSLSDVITVHAPYNPSTHHLINGQNIDKIKRGAVLVNTARGEIVETDALVKALQSGILSGAGLDVLEKDNKANQLLIDMPNVIVTPHIAFSSREAIAEIIKTTADNILSFINGTPKNIVEIK